MPARAGSVRFVASSWVSRISRAARKPRVVVGDRRRVSELHRLERSASAGHARNTSRSPGESSLRLRVTGVVLHMRGLPIPGAQLDALRDVIADLRAAGKRVVAWATHYSTASYYVACAADEVRCSPAARSRRSLSRTTRTCDGLSAWVCNSMSWRSRHTSRRRHAGTFQHVAECARWPTGSWTATSGAPRRHRRRAPDR